MRYETEGMKWGNNVQMSVNRLTNVMDGDWTRHDHTVLDG